MLYRYYDGLQYQAILSKGKGGKQEVVMAGGRYDGLVRMFAQEGTNSDGGGGGAPDGAMTVGAVGVNIAVEKIVTGTTPSLLISPLFPL
jgi:histidyl-tRNA synthetase